MGKSEEGRKWIPWCREFFRAREFEMEWDGRVRGRGRTNIGAPQELPDSPVLFLIWIAPIIAKMETAMERKFVGKRAEIEMPSYIDDLQGGIYIWEPDVAKRCNMGAMLKEANAEVNRIAEENHLPLEDSKHERLVLWTKRRKKSVNVKWVKWIGIIMDESLSFDKHWQSRIDKAHAMLGQLNGIGTSNWGISATSWRSIYTGMIRAVAMWGNELGWRGQKR